MRSIAKPLSRAVYNHPSEAGGGAGRASCEKVPAAVPLRLAGEGESVRIVGLRGGKGFHGRLAGMGLSVGARLEVIRNRFDGKIVLGYDGSRLFLGGGMALKIDVAIEGSNS